MVAHSPAEWWRPRSSPSTDQRFAAAFFVATVFLTAAFLAGAFLAVAFLAGDFFADDVDTVAGGGGGIDFGGSGGLGRIAERARRPNMLPADSAI